MAGFGVVPARVTEPDNKVQAQRNPAANSNFDIRDSNFRLLLLFCRLGCGSAFFGSLLGGAFLGTFGCRSFLASFGRGTLFCAFTCWRGFFAFFFLFFDHLDFAWSSGRSSFRGLFFFSARRGDGDYRNILVTNKFDASGRWYFSEMDGLAN